MHVSRRAITALAAGCALLSVATACSGSGGSGTDDAGGKVTLNLWTWTGAPGGPALRRALDSYQGLHPNVTVKVNEIAADDFKAKAPLALNGGQSIDVLAVQPNQFAQEVSSKLLPVTAWQKYLPAGTLDTYEPLALDQNKKLFSDGKLYSLPFGISGSAVGFYNAALLKEIGVQPPQTWADMANLAKVLKQKKPGVAVAALPAGSDAWFQDEFVLTLVGQQDKDFFDNVRYGKGKWDTPSYVQALTDYQKIFADGGLDKNLLDVNLADSEKAFDSGKAAIMFNGSWDSTLLSADYRKANKIDVADVGVLPVPATGDPSTRSLRSFLDVTMGIPKASSHPEEAADLIAYLTTGAGVNDWAKDLGLLPAVKGWQPPAGVLTSDAGKTGLQTIQRLLAEPHSDRNNMSAFSDEVGKKVEKVAGGGNPSSAAKDMQKDLDSGKYN